MQDLHDSTSPPASPPILIECREALPGKLRTHRKAPYQPS
jgi:hypothetical protein